MGSKQQQQRVDLKEVLAKFPEGAAHEQIADAAAHLRLSRNTLIRRLNELVEAGEIIKTGQSRAARYRLPGPSTVNRH